MKKTVLLLVLLINTAIVTSQTVFDIEPVSGIWKTLGFLFLAFVAYKIGKDYGR